MCLLDAVDDGCAGVGRRSWMVTWAPRSKDGPERWSCREHVAGCLPPLHCLVCEVASPKSGGAGSRAISAGGSSSEMVLGSASASGLHGNLLKQVQTL